jgi:hypothetical protein
LAVVVGRIIVRRRNKEKYEFSQMSSDEINLTNVTNSDSVLDRAQEV